MPFTNSVFLSATYGDLKEERSAAIETFTDLGILTYSMELFVSNFRNKQEVIEKLIGEADFVALIIGGKYGEYLPKEKLSFTEWEYDTATRYGKKILAFVPSDLNAIPVGKTDQDEEKKERLEEFIKKIKEIPLISQYNYGDIDGLKRAILRSFSEYGYRNKTLSEYCGTWVSTINELTYEHQFFGFKSDEWKFYGRGSNHVYGEIRRLQPENDPRTWSFVGMEFSDQLMISFTQNEPVTMSAGIVILRRTQGVDRQVSGYYYEFAKTDSEGKPIPIPIMLKRVSPDWHS